MADNPNTMKSNLKIIKSLHGKARRDHIWEYYRIPIIVLAVLIALGGYIAYKVTHPAPKTYLEVDNVGVLMDGPFRAALTQTLGQIIPADKQKKYAVTSDDYGSNGSNNPQYIQMLGLKLEANFMTGSLDILLLDTTSFDMLAQEGRLLSCDAYLTPEQKVALGNKLCIANAEIGGSNGSGGIQSVGYYGVALDGNAFFTGLGGNSDMLVLAVAVNTQRPDAVKQAVDLILGLQ